MDDDDDLDIHALTLDQSKLSSEQAEIYLLQYLSRASRAIGLIPLDDLKTVQSDFESSLLRILTLARPKPGRPLRQLVARCLVQLHTKSESRSLFEFGRELLKVVSGEGAGKAKDHDLQVKVACWYVMGELMRNLGANNMSFMADICTYALKQLKTSSLPVIVRYHAVLAMRKAFLTAGKAVSDSLGKEVVKLLRNGLADKALSIQRACAETLQTVFQVSSFISTLPELEAIITPSIKALDQADHSTRRALSRLIACLLSSTQIEGSARAVEPSAGSKKKKGAADSTSDDEGNPPAAAMHEAPKTLLSTTEMLKQLSTAFNRPNATRKTRNALVDVYATLFATLGTTYVEAYYGEIVGHLTSELISSPRNANISRAETLVIRRSVGILLRDLIGVRLLTEQGQIGAIRELVSSYLKKWPSLMPGQGPAPTELVLVPVLNEIAGLLEQLGNAPPPVQEVLADPLARLVAHPSPAVRVAAAWCLRCFCHTTPLRLAGTLSSLLGALTKDVALLETPTAPKDLKSRMLGRSQALASLIAVIPSRPLYVSYDLSANVLDLAISLLKRAGEHDVKTATIEVQVAWTLIGALMTLGPSFVKLHLPQLLVLWRNALPKPTSKDASAGARGESEWKFLLSVRAATLGSILAFLRHNLGPLVTLDVARRLVALLSNTLTFINNFSSQHADALRAELQLQQHQLAPASASTITLAQTETILRRRIFQCFTAIGPSAATESLHGTLLQSAIAVFADPEAYVGSAAQAAIAASAGGFTSIWDSTDGYAAGITSLVRGAESPPADGADPAEAALRGASSSTAKKNALNRDGVEVEIQALLTAPILGSLEYDPLELCSPSSSVAATTAAIAGSSTVSLLSIEQTLPSPVPAATAVVDAALDLFAALAPAAHDPDALAKLIAQINAHVRSSKLERNPAKKMAVFVNAVEALRRALRSAMSSSSGSRKARDMMGSPQVANAIRELLQAAIVDADLTLRTAGSESLGRLVSMSSGTAFMNGSIQWLVDQVVQNRNPEARAGCALAFGAVFTYVGSLIGGPLLKTMVNVLVSLASDPHPVVHFWSMAALAQVIAAASLSYEPFVPSTLGQLASIYLAETHEPEGGSLGSVNLRGDLPAYQVVCRILSALVGILGPELQEPGPIRSLIFLLVDEFAREDDEGVSVEAIKCHQQFLMFAPGQVDVPRLVASFRTHLSSSGEAASGSRPLKVASIDALYQLVQRDAALMSRLGGNQLVEDLFGLLDDDPSLEGVRDVISNWAKQTSAASPSGWIDLCQRIMNRTNASQQVVTNASAAIGGGAGARFQDDEVESIVQPSGGSSSHGGVAHGTLTGGGGGSGGPRLTSRWRTQLFALQCLHEVVRAVVAAGRPEQFDARRAREMGLPARAVLVSRVGDLIKMAFSASTAQVTEIRLQGLIVLRDVIQHFSASPDPEVQDALLLEQHQAPIAAALTPAFAADATPEVLASAVRVCAAFVGSGVIQEVDRMGRILKLLVGALEQCQDTDMVSLGEVDNLSTNASVMLKISVLTAWAELQSSSVKRPYLRAVLAPHRRALAPFWVTSLRDYARIRTDPDATTASDLAASGLGREVLLPYYERSWAPILQAIACLMEDDDPFVLCAMDGIELPAGASPPPSVEDKDAASVRTEPTTNFFVIYGLAFEALATGDGPALFGPTADSETPVAVVSLAALRSLVQRRYAGSALLEPALFDELCTLFYRLAMTAPVAVQAIMVRVLSTLAKSHSGATLNTSSSDDSSSTQLARCLGIVAYVLRQSIPLALEPFRHASETPADRVLLIKNSFISYLDIVDLVPTSSSSDDKQRKEDLYAVAIYLYSELLRDEFSKVDLVGPTLPLLKTLCDRAYAARRPESQTFPRVINGLLSACIGHIDDMRGRAGPVAATKVKNNLLAITLLFTALPADVPVSRAVIERTCNIIGQKLSEEDEVAVTAVQCAKTLLLTSFRGSPTVQHCVGQLVPAIVLFLGRLAADGDGDDSLSSPRTTALVEDVVKALVGFATGLPTPAAAGHAGNDDFKARAYVVLLPTLILLLDPGVVESSSTSTPTPTHTTAVTHLLALANQSPAAFKDATAGLDPDARTRLETSVRRAIEGQQRRDQPVVTERKAAPAIQLRSFG